MESILETQRNLHEERERCIDAMTKEFLSEKRTVSIILKILRVTVDSR